MTPGDDAQAGKPEQEQEPEDHKFFDPGPLRKMRKALRLTQAELAALLGIHRTYLVLIEKGKKIPSPRLERSILDFMDKAEQQSLSPQTLWNQIKQPNANALVPEPP